jgi:hypothetical protein
LGLPPVSRVPESDAGYAQLGLARRILISYGGCCPATLSIT